MTTVMNVPSTGDNLVPFLFAVKTCPRLRDAVYDYHMYPSGLFSFSLCFSVSRYGLLSRVNFISVDKRHKKFRSKRKIDKKIRNFHLLAACVIYTVKIAVRE